MARIMSGEVTHPEQTHTAEAPDDVVIESTEEKGLTEVFAPISGEVVDITKVPDEVFAGKMMGEGVAVIPEEGVVYAPFDGVVKMDFPTKHALGLESEEGLEMLIHFGLETVGLKGQGFEVLVNQEMPS